MRIALILMLVFLVGTVVGWAVGVYCMCPLETINNDLKDGCLSSERWIAYYITDSFVVIARIKPGKKGQDIRDIEMRFITIEAFKRHFKVVIEE